MNHEPRTSYKVLQLAAATYPGAFRSLDFVKVLTNILTILGDLHQLRWLFQSVLNIEPSTASNSKASESTLESVIKTKYFNAKEELDLWEEFLHAETVLGLSCTARLNELRKKRDRARKDYEDSERFKFDAIIASRSESKTLSFGIFEASADMIERYELLTVLEDGYITTTDNDFRSRIHTCVSDIRSSDSRLNRILSNNTGNSSKATINMSADFHLSLAGLPVVLRNLLSKLPFHSGPSPDYDGFIRHVKNIILPPRPEEVADEAVGLNSKLNDESLLENNLMQAEWLRQLEGNNDIYLDGGFQEVSDHKSISGNSGKSKLEVEDIFRKRQRIKRTVHNA